MKIKFSPYNIMLSFITIFTIIILINQLLIPLFEDDNDTDNIRVGVIDSGCARSQNNFVKSYRTFTLTDNGYPYDDIEKYDTNGHGTVVCKLIYEEFNDVSVYSARIADSFDILTYEGIFSALNWLIEDIEVDIINLSLGSSPYISELLDEYFIENQNTTIFVAATGNEASSNFYSNGIVHWPSVYPWVIGVGAYSELNSSIRADYSSYGRSYFGNYVVDFHARGKTEFGSGTSFASATITGKLANFMQILENKGLSLGISEIYTLFALYMENLEPDNFSFELGWGDNKDQNTSFDELLKINQTLLINGGKEIDLLKRVTNESWSKVWKFSTFNMNELQIHDSITFSGNGSSFINLSEINLNDWGGTLELKLKATSVLGNFQIKIENSEGNDIEYNFEIKSTSRGKILIDHRASVNGFGHPDGEFLFLEQFLREKKYEVDHLLIGNPTNLNDYQHIVIPKLNEVQTVEKFEITREFPIGFISTYIDYVNSGGSLIVTLDFPQFTSKVNTNTFLNNFGANYTRASVGIYDGRNPLCCTEVVSNFTSNSIAQTVQDFKFLGGEVKSINSSVNEIGWVLKIANNGQQSIKIYRSIGVIGNLNMGNFMILGSSQIFTNYYFNDNQGLGLDLLISNFLELN